MADSRVRMFHVKQGQNGRDKPGRHEKSGSHLAQALTKQCADFGQDRMRFLARRLSRFFRSSGAIDRSIFPQISHNFSLFHVKHSCPWENLKAARMAASRGVWGHGRVQTCLPKLDGSSQTRQRSPVAIMPASPMKAANRNGKSRSFGSQ